MLPSRLSIAPRFGPRVPICLNRQFLLPRSSLLPSRCRVLLTKEIVRGSYILAPAAAARYLAVNSRITQTRAELLACYLLTSTATARESKRGVFAYRMTGGSEAVRNAEKLVESVMKSNDASHDAAHVFRVRDLALSLASEEGLSSSPDSMLIVELAALLHDIEDYKYLRDPSEEKITENFLEAEGIEESKKMKILSIIKRMGFKEELGGNSDIKNDIVFGVVQDADRLDAIGAIGIARCFTFGGSRNRVLHDPTIKPRSNLSKGSYTGKNEQTTVNHFHEKLLRLKDLMKTEAGKRRAERRHKFMEDFLQEFYEEWDGKA